MPITCTGTVLPPDVWIHVAQFIPHDDLCSMIDVNSTFFHLAMDAKYHEVKLRDFKKARELKDMVSIRSRAIRSLRAKLGHVDDTATVKMEGIRRLRNPAIAPRVRYLRVVFGMKEREQRKFDKLGKNSRQHVRSILQENVQAMTDTVACLTNVTAFTIDLRHLPVQPEDLIPFFNAAWKTFGRNLQAVHLYTKPTYLSTLLPTMEGLPAVALDELGVGLTRLYNRRRNQQRIDGTMLATSLAPFINKFPHTLRYLTVGSWVDSDHMEPLPLFSHLENFPHLSWVTLYMNCEGGILSDPDDFTRFLRNHATVLHHLRLSMNPKESMLSDGRWEETVVEWLSRKELDGVVFPNLSSLEIAIPRPAGVALIMELITHSTGTLTKLVIHNFSLNYNEVNALMTSLGSHRESLQELILVVKFLSPELVLLLATKLPHLRELGLRVCNVASQNGPGEVESTTQKKELKNAQKFAAIMRTYEIRHWPLQDIIIWTLECRDSKIDRKLMRVFADCVPSVQKIGGKDKDLFMMDSDNLL